VLTSHWPIDGASIDTPWDAFLTLQDAQHKLESKFSLCVDCHWNWHASCCFLPSSIVFCLDNVIDNSTKMRNGDLRLALKLWTNELRPDCRAPIRLHDVGIGKSHPVWMGRPPFWEATPTHFAPTVEWLPPRNAKLNRHCHYQMSVMSACPHVSNRALNQQRTTLKATGLLSCL